VKVRKGSSPITRMRMIMLSMENNFENKRFGEMFWNNWITGISNLIESNSYNFEYEKINTMFEMSLSSYVNWNYEPETSKDSKSVLIDQVGRN